MPADRLQLTQDASSASARWAEAAALTDAARQTRDAAIRAAAAVGVTAYKLAQVTGLSRQQIGRILGQEPPDQG